MPSRRARAVLSSMRPALRSASMAICLPGMASRVKRAATSAMRPAPLVMTTNWITTRMMNTTKPTTKLPPTTNCPKALMTEPAAAVPSWPCRSTSRAEATFRARRNSVRTRSSEGNTENSTGFRMYIDTKRVRSETLMLVVSIMSRRRAGTGTIIMARIPTTATASTSSVPRMV
jgi:hypothetical protein